MDDNVKSLLSLFRRLCELAFLTEASKREDAYKKIFYTNLIMKKLRIRLYEKLFMELQAPWIGTMTARKDGKHCKNMDLNAHEKIALMAFNLRLKREFDKADLLEYYCTKWKLFKGPLTSTTEASETNFDTCETEAVLRFLVALSNIDYQDSSPVLGYQNDLLSTLPKELICLLPEGPLLHTDSSKIRHQSLLEDQYILYSRDLFEKPQTIVTHVSNIMESSTVFPEIMAPCKGRRRFFTIQETGEVLYDKKTRLTVFGALSHGYTDDMQVKLGLPDLPQVTEKTFGVSSLSTAQASPDDEGFHELTDSTATYTSTQTNPESFESSLESGLDIWTEALKLPTQKFYTWEMEGRRDGLLDRPYISEAGPEVFDELYNLIYKQVSYLTKTPTHYTMTKVKILNRHSLDVLIGVPTTTFLYNMDVPGFNVNADVRLSGCSPESLNATLSKLASIGTNYQNLVNFINHKEQTGGLVLHAFLGGLRNYLHCYRSVVLDFHDASMQSPLQLSFIFQNIGRQLRFLSDVCMCSSQSRPKGNTRQSSFPTGVKLLSYLYKLCLEHSSTDQYPVLLSLLKHSCAPYILFVQQWVFQGICRDVYEEFIIEVDDQFLAYRDKHFWSHGFVISEKDKLDCVPMFLSELANDIFVCGKSINLMKLCSPRHFLCDSGVPPPKMEVTFSMSKLKAIDQNCEDYVYAIEDISNTLKQKKEQQRIALEQAKEKVLMEERQRAEKALAEVTGLINDVKEAIDAKKKADLKMLKEQMEEAIKKRQLDKQLEDELDNQYMVDALNRAAADEELREKARQELIDYYKLLTEEMDRREERAQWKIKRHELNKRRLEFFAQEQVNLENLQEEAAKNPIKPVENVSSTRLTTVRAASVTQSSERTSVQSPSLSIVSLIASGIKTDAMIQSEVNKSTTISSAADSGVETDKTVAEGDVSEGQTFNSFASLDEADDTDTSIASTISAAPASRKKWSSSEDVKPFDVKTEYRSKRRMWDSADDNINLAESPFPHGHPSESSIQFSLYSVDKNVHDDIVTSPVVPPSIQTNTPNPSNSSIQNIMYPSGSAMSQDDSNRTLTGASHNRNTESDDNSAIQGSLKSDQSNDDPVIRDFVRSLSTGVNGLSSPTHRPSYSLDHPVESTDQTTLSGRLSEYGHPSDTQFNSAGDYLSRFGLSVPIPSGRRSPFGHPSDTQLDSAGTHSQERTALEQTPSKHRSPYGHPSDTRLDSTDSTPQNASTRRLWGHPSDSKVQNLLMNMSSVSEAKQPLKDFSPNHSSAIHPLTTRGTAPVDSIKDVLYPEDGLVSQDEQRHISRGHEPAVKITKLMYPDEQKTEPAPEPTKPLLFEDVWIASEVQPLQVNFDILDKHPTNNLLKSALSAIPMCEDDLDNDDDIDAAQLMSLPVLLRRSVTAPLVAQISLVNSAVVEYFMDDLKLMHHFEIFRKFLFMEDGEFALSLSEQLFEKLSTGVNPGEMCSPATMNAIVTRALQLSVYANKTGFEQRLSFALKSLPDVFNMNDIGTLDFLELRYQVPWPVNIIITENSIIKYNKVFSFMLRLKRVAWVLQEIWFHLKHIGFSRRAAGSPQLRQLQLFRHEMLHFLQNIDGYLSNQILNVTWVEFQQELVTNARDLDELHHRHTEYLNKAVFRSLLSKKATPVMKIISDMFSLVLKFRTQLLSCPWQQNGECSHVVHPRFDVMCATHKAFKEYSGFLFTVLSKLVRRGYQAHLQDFLLRLNFNDFYKT